MSQGCDLSILEELTSNAKKRQDNVLNKILKANANTEYLSRFLEGSSDKELFKKNVPVVSYEDVKPYIDRVANGEPSDILSGEPITAFTLRHVDGYNQGKVMIFRFTHPISTTPCGLPLAPVVTILMKSKHFLSMEKRSTIAKEIIRCPDKKQSMYCQLLCGLVQSRETRLSGHLSEWITDLSCRDSVSIILGEPNPELADLVEKECTGQESWQGIITRLWPKTKCVETIVTETLAQYIPVLEFYSNKLPLVSKNYASSETFFGINLNPLSKPEHVSYTFLPNMAYFEFIDVGVDGGTEGEIVDLVDVKLGHYYEPLVTNYYGLHRCRVGDVLQVTGFYNKAPQFRFLRRKNTGEVMGSRLTNNLIMELERTHNGGVGFGALQRCEHGAHGAGSSHGAGCHRTLRRQDGLIGALEVRIVQKGTFDSLMEFFVSRGDSITQYKTPICINSVEALKVLEDKVLARFFSDKSPPI
ncbi:hypothetical protein YC2023_104263 [Brassica napus]